jgi:hypothetical protein
LIIFDLGKYTSFHHMDGVPIPQWVKDSHGREVTVRSDGLREIKGTSYFSNPLYESVSLLAVGQQVYVIDELTKDADEYDAGFSQEMIHGFLGKKVTIQSVSLHSRGDRYRIVEDNGDWSWSIDMFEIDSRYNKNYVSIYEVKNEPKQVLR